MNIIGLGVMLVVALLLSERRREICWRTVVVGFGLQVGFGLLVLRTGAGRVAFEWFRRGFVGVIGCSRAGAEFIFGPLIPEGGQFVFFISVPCTLIFFSGLMALLYHWGIMPRIIRAMAWVMHRTMRTSGRESLVAAANVFVGMTEAPLVIRPYLENLTRSELMALMTTGLATVAGTVMALYVSWGIDAGHLMTAAVMSAPAALVFAKIIVPPRRDEWVGETGETPVLQERAVNALQAVAQGARDGLFLALNVCAMLIAMLSLIRLVNTVLGATGLRVGGAPVTLETLFGYLGYPVARLLGVSAVDAGRVGGLLSTQVFCTELVAYRGLVEQMGSLAPRSVVIATYALCGFANFASLAILIGALNALAPGRKNEVAQLAWKALVAGLLASYSTAGLAGLLV
ncbi:MAG: NupC/NupG family nucleoside CNT transporter [bacterium]|nr:NupC/NupG family nucleoside CNT transporter [bacterium]